MKKEFVKEFIGLCCCIIVFVTGIFMIFKTGVTYGEDRALRGIEKDTITIVRIDTVTYEKVIPKGVVVERVIYDTLFSRDSVLIEVGVPISRYVYSDSLYRAEVSGYKVSLDKMEVYNKDVTHNITNTVIKRVPKRWGIGLSVGYSFTPKGFQPYIGVGLNYNVISF